MNNKGLFFPLFIVALLSLSGLSLPVRADDIAAIVSIEGRGVAPNQVVTLSTGPAQNLTAQATPAGSFAFSNLHYVPTDSLTFALNYSVKGGLKEIPNNLLLTIDPYSGTVAIKGNATRAASVVLSVATEDSAAIVANQDGYFSGRAESFKGFENGNFQVVSSVINVEEGCCPRSFKPYTPVTVTISARPDISATPDTPANAIKKTDRSIIHSTDTASLEISLPSQNYGVTVPADLIKKSWVDGMSSFANAIVQHLMLSTTSQGSFLDGQNNVEARHTLQNAAAATAKNYLPSEELCRFGTLSQSLVSSDAIARANKTSLAKMLLSHELGAQNTIGASTGGAQQRWTNFTTNNCDPTDSNLGLKKYCKGKSNGSRYNADVDYTRMVDAPMTIPIDLSDTGASAPAQDILALADNIYPPAPQNVRADSSKYVTNSKMFNSLQAIRSVAKNSFVSQVSEKMQGTAGSAVFIGKLMKAMGIPEENADTMMGPKPSYYAQMEVLTKKIYQDPAFYVNLMDTPANLARQRTAIRAVKLQQQNDFAAVVKRREMLLATLLELKIRERSASVDLRLRPANSAKSTETTPANSN